MNNPVGWFELYVNDMPRAQAFYEQVLGVTLEALPMPEGSEATMQMLAFPMNPEGYGAPGALVKCDAEGAGPSPGGTVVYFGCEDCAVQAGRIESSGGVLVQDKMSIGQYGFVAMAKDTEGNLVGFHSQK